jgi:Tfp pilus assembly protein PilO
MFDLNSLFQLLTFLLVSVLGFMLYLFKTGAEAAVKTSAEEAARATIQQLKWPVELAQELQKTRGVERQENRYKCYGALG